MVRFINDSRARPTCSSPLVVIGAGLPRTATSSLQAALEELGYDPCLHMAQVIPHADRMETLIEATREKDTQRRQHLIHRLVNGYEMVCDMPAVFFLADLMDMYPKAKVVLTTRPNAETWATSCRASLGFFFTRPFYWVGLLRKCDRLWYQQNMYILEWSQETYGVGDVFTASMYEKYNESVRQIAKERGREILEFKAEDGWKPLCKFLKKDVPGSDFPRVNEKKALTIVKGIILTRGLLSWAAVGGTLWLCWKYLPGLFE
ncbi:hypothetical protein N7532_011939 [Penicillium argentinense]|uniref:NAD dependent epimerase/dehydratase n=1 Tax=Penicillium argentinense TaxID=1131581 RepID=A0A9W9EJB8_9EURO|nr:uncharacterized protein N7532_011939 [Penicillium argentinense]KAJ5082896.1 hypothetical protein N7532_011939 [Penicillium argentinense]